MSNLAELRRHVIVLNRSIQEYAQLLDSFIKSNAEHIQLIKNELQGDSDNPHIRRMIACLTASDESIKASANALTRASSALARVETL